MNEEEFRLKLKEFLLEYDFRDSRSQDDKFDGRDVYEAYCKMRGGEDDYDEIWTERLRKKYKDG